MSYTFQRIPCIDPDEDMLVTETATGRQIHFVNLPDFLADGLMRPEGWIEEQLALCFLKERYEDGEI